MISRIKAKLASIVLLLTVFSGPAAAVDGPLQVRNQFPFFLGSMPPYLEPAELRDSVSIGLSHSSVYMVKERLPWGIAMDIEMTELDIRLKKTLGQRFEVGVDLPVIRPTKGFFDTPLSDWHSLLGVGDYGRSRRPKNTYLYAITYDNRPVIEGVNDRTGLGDVRLTMKYGMLTGPSRLSLLAAVEAPTGDARTGYGNGSYDSSGAILYDTVLADRYHLYLNGGVILPGDLRGYQVIALRTSWYGGAGLEAAWWTRGSAIVQCLARTSPLPHTGSRAVDQPGIILVTGGRYYLETGSIEFSLTEDPNTSGAPDFIANVGYTHRF